MFSLFTSATTEQPTNTQYPVNGDVNNTYISSPLTSGIKTTAKQSVDNDMIDTYSNHSDFDYVNIDVDSNHLNLKQHDDTNQLFNHILTDISMEPMTMEQINTNVDIYESGYTYYVDEKQRIVKKIKHKTDEFYPMGYICLRKSIHSATGKIMYEYTTNEVETDDANDKGQYNHTIHPTSGLRYCTHPLQLLMDNTQSSILLDTPLCDALSADNNKIYFDNEHVFALCSITGNIKQLQDYMYTDRLRVTRILNRAEMIIHADEQKEAFIQHAHAHNNDNNYDRIQRIIVAHENMVEQIDIYTKLNIIHYIHTDTTVHYKDGEIHRVGELPAIYNKNSKFYIVNGKLHRDHDQPAVICEDYSVWYCNNKRHRLNNKPAYIKNDGTNKYYKDGEIHRENGLPAIIYSDGTQEWYENGRLHRMNDLPAVEFSTGRKIWYEYGNRVRDNYGPKAAINRKITCIRSFAANCFYRFQLYPFEYKNKNEYKNNK